MKNILVNLITLTVTLTCTSGCWLVAAGAGAEAGYVASQESRTTGETVQDQLIVTKVKSALLADQEVSGLDINVDSFKSSVTLKGVVETVAEADRAIRIARTTSGVKNVVSKLVVQP